MPAVSVIIPAYNAAAYLPRCIRHLQDQSFGDWEALVVDDGSTDGTASLLDSYAAQDARIKAIHKENGGVSAARNEALQHAEGKYVLFVDSDDFLHPQTLELCVGLAERDQADLVAFTYNRHYRTRLIIRHFLHLPDPSKLSFPHYGNPETLFTEDLLSHATEYSRPEPGQDKRWLVKHCQPWRCLYRKACIQDIRFIPGIIYEDFPWWSQVLLQVKRVTILNLPLYYYYPNPTSYILSSREAYKVRSLRQAIAAAQDVFQAADPNQKAQWERRFLRPFQEKLAKKERHVQE
jgi:glycosyltransferase involved in cell wall biosynthesis